MQLFVKSVASNKAESIKKMMTTAIAMPARYLSLAQLAIQLFSDSDINSPRDKEQMFRSMLGSNERIINRICYTYARSGDEFNDLRQDALLNIWRAMDSFRGESSESTWIYRITINSCVSYFRKPGVKTDFVSLSNMLNRPEDTGLSETDNSIMLHEMIARLPPQDKALLLLWLDELPYDEIAQLMGYPRNTIASRLHRIRGKLSKMAQTLKNIDND